VLDEVMRELADREDVDEVEEQLERRELALGAGRPRDGDPHADVSSGWPGLSPGIGSQ
jgi:hypothetical protein